jgi:hypothetical protein
MRKRDIIIFAVVISGLVAVTAWTVISIQQERRMNRAGSLAAGPYARIGRMRSRTAGSRIWHTNAPLRRFAGQGATQPAHRTLGISEKIIGGDSCVR